MENQIVHLTGGHTSLIVRCTPYAEILYWGNRLSQFSADDIISLSRAVPNGRIDVEAPVNVSADSGRGSFGTPGVEGHRDGLDWSPVFNTTQVKHDENQLTITTEDAIAGLQFRSELRLDNSGVLQTRNALTNLKPGTYQVTRLAVTLPLPRRAAPPK